jgi:hypothetical protein
MEGTETYKLLATLPESNAAAANEPHQLMRPLHPLDLRFVDQHQFRLFLKKSCQEESAIAN